MSGFFKKLFNRVTGKQEEVPPPPPAVTLEAPQVSAEAEPEVIPVVVEPEPGLDKLPSPSWGGASSDERREAAGWGGGPRVDPSAAPTPTPTPPHEGEGLKRETEPEHAPAPMAAEEIALRKGFKLITYHSKLTTLKKFF